MEIWKQYRDTFYEASNMGNVRSVERIVTRSNGRRHSVGTRILKPALDKKGYLRIGIVIDGKLTTLKVHRVICECYHENPLNLPQVNHKDGNKQNNAEWNVEWSTGSHNVQHAYDTGLITNIYEPVADKTNFPHGINNHEAKLTENDVVLARAMRKQGKTFQSIANIFNVNKKTMMHAIKGVTWKHIK